METMDESMVWSMDGVLEVLGVHIIVEALRSKQVATRVPSGVVLFSISLSSSPARLLQPVCTQGKQVASIVSSECIVSSNCAFWAQGHNDGQPILHRELDSNSPFDSLHQIWSFFKLCLLSELHQLLHSCCKASSSSSCSFSIFSYEFFIGLSSHVLCPHFTRNPSQFLLRWIPTLVPQCRTCHRHVHINLVANLHNCRDLWLHWNQINCAARFTEITYHILLCMMCRQTYALTPHKILPNKKLHQWMHLCCNNLPWKCACHE